jgi:hypothetical protein
MVKNAAINLTLNATLRKLLHLIVLLLATSSALGVELSGQVVNISADNHFLLQTADGRRYLVGLAGIRFAPFTGRSKNLIRQHLQTLLAGRFVNIETTTPAKPGVILGRVRHGNSDIGLRLIRSGLAFTVEPSPLDPALQQAYKKAEAEARRYKMGYWQTR